MEKRVADTEWWWVEGEIFEAQRRAVIFGTEYVLVINKHRLGELHFDEEWYFTVNTLDDIEITKPIRIGSMTAKSATQKVEFIIEQVVGTHYTSIV